MKRIIHFYRKINNALEYCFNVEISEELNDGEMHILRWLLSETYEPEFFATMPFIGRNVTEVGPRLNFATAWNTNALSILHACGIDKVTRIERSRRLEVPGSFISTDEYKIWRDNKYDRMTEMVYVLPLRTFETGIKPEAVYEIPLIENGPDVLLEKKYGLKMDEWDRNLYYKYFALKLKKNPTIVEIKDLYNANSEHSRHGFFKGRIVINGEAMPMTMMETVQSTLQKNPRNSVLAFCDNSSAIQGYEIKTIIPEKPGRVSRFREGKFTYHIIFTAETHNFPSGVAPFPGAETGTGGRIRDVQATGRGGLVVAGTAGYCVGGLNIPGYELPWESSVEKYPEDLASPLQIEIEASNGASDYGNKFGEPVIQGFTRSFDLRLPDGKRRAWLKPIMFTGGVGQIDERHLRKNEAQKGMLMIGIGGPAYRIGKGGGAASSLIQGENLKGLDFDAVQRGDAEMEQKMNRIVRACGEIGDENPIVSIHDQGAGGPANVLKELVEKAGGRVELRRINSGDPTLSVEEYWTCEFQERNGLLIWPERLREFKEICAREKVYCEELGIVTGDGIFIVHDEQDDSTPVYFHLEDVLGNVPQKTFSDTRVPPALKPLEFSETPTIREALERVLRKTDVCSKRFLVNKVDRSVTGLIAQQQNVGSLQLPLSDVAIISQSHFPNEKGKYTGAAISIGEQPIKMLVNQKAGGRMATAEALTNMVWAKISAMEDIKCSGNWMWAAKQPGEAANIYDAACAVAELMRELGFAIDGGKDSLSMAAVVGEEIVKAPGQLVISAYCTMPDITKVVTPDIKRPGSSRLIFIDLAKGKRRLGGSVLAQCYEQIGNECPDVEDLELLKRAFNAIQELIGKDLILAGHDVSDGGLIVTLLEMAFAGNCGMEVFMPVKDFQDPSKSKIISTFFAEEAGLVIEYLPEDEKEIVSIIEGKNKVGIWRVGETLLGNRIIIRDHIFGGNIILDEDMRVLRGIWEETSMQLDLQTQYSKINPECVREEYKNIYDRKGPQYHLSFDPNELYSELLSCDAKYAVAIIREEGSNSDREMTSAFYQAGFEVHDVTITDLLSGKITSLDMFRGLAFVGGFSYADVLDSAKGWAGVIRFRLWEMFKRFYDRPDTFSLGICNGCQLMALLGLVPWQGIESRYQPRFIHNISGRFESRFSTVRILPDSPAIMLKGMENSTLGIWVAHGEGRAYFPDKKILEEVKEKGLAPIRYVDDLGIITNDYPFNPNGSEEAIAALCSSDGRHLAIMPHPERTFIPWQWPWMPEEFKKLKVSPWMRMFQNALKWCDETK